MKVISFDVGIKNMAYCFLDVSGNKVSICDWNVLNLLEEPVVLETCSQMTPGKTKKVLPKPCSKKAKYRKNEQCYCEKHAKSGSPFIIPTKKNSMTYLKKLKVDELIKIGQTNLLFLGSENLPKLKKDILEKIGDFYEKKCFEPVIPKKNKNASEIDLISIGKKMKELLNNAEGINETTHVVIENQISPIANRMKTIQGMLAQYFIMKNSDIEIDFVSSANKLNQFKNPMKDKTISKVVNSDLLENTLIENNDYKQNKKDGIYYSSLIMEKNPCFNMWQETMNVSKKKDDLADSFLQGLWYLKNKNIISYADDLKIIFV